MRRQVDPVGEPFVGDLADDSCDQSQAGGLVGEDADDARAAADLPGKTFQAVGGAYETTVGSWEREDGESLRDVLF